MSRPICCGRPSDPFAIIEAFVETTDGVEVTVDGDGAATLDYDPTGWTNELGDTQRTIGYGCRECGTITITVSEIDFGGTKFTLEPVAATT